MKTFIKFSVLLFLIYGCTHRINCSDLGIVPAFISFDSTDIDTLILEKYKLNDNYQSLIDTFKIIRNVSAIYQTSNDTTLIYNQPYGENQIKAGYDWKILIPSLNRTILISDITGKNNTEKCGDLNAKCFCYNTVYSLKQDGQVINFSSSFRNSYTLFTYTIFIK